MGDVDLFASGKLGTFLAVAVGLAGCLLWSSAMPRDAGAGAWPRCQYYSPYACKAKSERACGKVVTYTEGSRVRSRVYARNTSCRSARRFVKYGKTSLPRGWQVMFGSGEGAVYAKGRRKSNAVSLPWRRYVRYTNLPRNRTAGLIPADGRNTPQTRRFCGNNPRWIWVSDINARGVSCKTAYRITKRHGQAGYPCWSKGICRIQRYRCKTTSSHEGWSSFRCKRGRKVIRFKNGG